MLNARLLLATASAFIICHPARSQGIPSPTFGNLAVQQNDAANTTASVTVTVAYGQAALSADGVTSLGNLAVRTGSNRGDFNVRFSGTAANDRALGVMLTNVSQIYRDNTAFGDTIGPQFATSATDNASGYFIPVHTSPGGDEFNVNLAVAWFPYADGWIGGHAINSANGGVLTSLAASPGLTLSTTAAGSNVLYDPGATGQYELNLTGIDSQTDGILLVSGGKNEDNFALSRANADGTWSIFVKDNGSNTTTTEADGLAFAYIPKTAVVTGANPGIHAMGRLNGNLTRDVTAGNYVITRTAVGKYRLLAPGIDPTQAVLLLSSEWAGVAQDNILLYEADSKGWNLEQRDLPTPLSGLQDNTSGEDTLSFILMAGGSTAGSWDAGGTDTAWSTAANWAGDVVPAAGTDVVIGPDGSAMLIDAPQVAGLVMINRDTSFNISGTSTLTLNSGLVVNGAPSSSQIFTISAPLVLGDDALLVSQTTGSTITLRLNVASGNAVTSAGKNLTFGGSTNHEVLDPIDLGTGLMIKEGAGQATLTAVNTVGGTVIVTGPNSSTNGAFRLNGSSAYQAFGPTITMQNNAAVTALYFDAGAGSGTLSSDIVLQSSTASAATRFTTDASAAFNATLSGRISGGNSTSEFWVDNESATGQGRLHLTNTGNTFIAPNIVLNRGGLVIYGDGSLGDPSNGLYLNNNNTTALTGNGLHFGADKIELAASRTITVNTATTVNTGTYHSVILGTVTGAGGVIKAGTGVLEMKGANNNYTGGTTVKQGTLLFTPAQPDGTAGGSGGVVVESGATLAGSGAVTGIVSVQSGGFLSPGAVRNAASELRLDGGLVLAAGSEATFNLFGSGTHDRIIVGASASFGLDPSARLKVVLQATPAFGQSFDLLDWVTLTGDSDLVNNLDFSAADISSHGWFWDTSSFNSDGVITVVPEPSRAFLIFAGLAGLATRRGRRRRL